MIRHLIFGSLTLHRTNDVVYHYPQKPHSPQSLLVLFFFLLVLWRPRSFIAAGHSDPSRWSRVDGTTVHMLGPFRYHVRIGEVPP